MKRERLIWVDGVPALEVTTTRPITSPATLETLSIIRAQPGINPTDIARERGVTPRAAHTTVIYLERLQAVRTEIEPRDGNRFHRACYLTETP